MNNARGQVVLVEGLDLAGKSTLTSSLRKQLETKYSKVIYSRNALVPDNPFAIFADKERKNKDVSINETCPLFISAHLFDAYNFLYPGLDEIHLQDSSWMRTVAFNTVRQNEKFLPLILKVASFQPIFDAVIYLTASIEARKSRITQRESENPDDIDHSDYLVHTDPELFENNDTALLETTQKYCEHVDVVDTSEISPEEVILTATRLLEVRGIL